MKSKEFNKEFNALQRKIVIGLIVFILFILLISSIVIVPAGFAGVKTRFGAVVEPFLDEGLHFKIPIIEKVRKIEVKTQKMSVSTGAASKDLQTVSASVVVNFKIQKDQAPTLYQTVGMAYASRIIEPGVHEVVKSVTAQYTAEELITKRSLVKVAIEDSFRERLMPRGIIVEEVSITDFDFSPSFNAAIEAKVTAEQKKLQAERDLQRIEIEAKQIQATAEGEKNAEIARSEGQAEAIRIIEEQLRQSPNYLEYYKLDKWNGVLPLVSGQATPLITIN